MKGENAAIVRRKVSGPRWAGICFVVFLMLGSGYALAPDDGLGPALRTDAASYQPGDQVYIQLRNGLRPAGYNLCAAFLDLQRQGAHGWDAVSAYLGPPTEHVAVCTAEMRTLPPLGRREATVYLPSDLPEGEYRLVHVVEIGGARQGVPTDPFTVVVVD